jgi:arsenate reductase
MSFEIWHNPRCSKSRAALSMLQAAGHDPRIVKYLETPPDAAHLAHICGLLGFSSPLEMMRKGETEYKAADIDGANAATLIDFIHNTPRVIERPIVIWKNRHAVIGRPPEAVEKLLHMAAPK